MKINYNIHLSIGHIVLSALLIIVSLFTTSCSSSSDGPDNPVNPTVDNDGFQSGTTGNGPFFIAVRTPNSTEYVLQAADIENKKFHVRDNFMELPSVHYTWLFNGKTAIGMSYQQSDPGVGYAFQLQADNSLKQLGQFEVRSRFTNYDFFDANTFITSVGGQLSQDGKRNDGATFEFWNVTPTSVTRHHTKTIWTQDITKTGDQITFSSIVNMGDGTFLSAVVKSDFRELGSGGGSSVGNVQFPDSVWIARMDTALNIKAIYADDRLSYAAGQYRAQMFREVLRTNDGTVYAFSNAFNANTTQKAGALRINRGANGFDPDYYYNIQEASGGYKFRRVWYLTDAKFLLEFYNSYQIETLSPGHQYAIVDMQQKQLTWLKGLPAKGDIISGAESGGVPMFLNGYIYLPITKRGEQAGIYKIDINTAEGKKITTIEGAEEVRSIGYLH